MKKREIVVLVIIFVSIFTFVFGQNLLLKVLLRQRSRDIEITKENIILLGNAFKMNFTSNSVTVEHISYGGMREDITLCAKVDILKKDFNFNDFSRNTAAKEGFIAKVEWTSPFMSWWNIDKRKFLKIYVSHLSVYNFTEKDEKTYSVYMKTINRNEFFDKLVFKDREK